MVFTSRSLRTAIILLSAPLLLWILALLFLFHVSDFFHAFLMKTLGPWVLYGIMALFPLFALHVAWRIRKSHSRLVIYPLFGTGILLFAAFVIVIGSAIASDWFGPKVEANPSTPRPLPPQVGLSVFPGAEGFGTRTPAGRGGKVIVVTNLSDNGPGSLREALSDPSPRIIVFQVAGTVELQEEIPIMHPFVTVAGQTAPGGGVCIKNAGLAIMTHDVLLRHIRIRPGNEGKVDADNNDAIAVFRRQADIDDVYNVVIDHVSTGWSEDETVSILYGAHDVTISWSVIGEALNRSRHRKETHSAGLLIGYSAYNVSMHHNLFAHNDFRNPLISSGGTHDFVNNVVYDWGVLACEIVDQESNTFANFIGNTYKAGPSTSPDSVEFIVHPTDSIPRLFFHDNIGPHRRPDDVNPNANAFFGWDQRPVPASFLTSKPITTPILTISPAEEAFVTVLAQAGAVRPVRDTVDLRLEMEVRQGTGKIIDSPREVGGYPALDLGQPIVDMDRDGMADAWEIDKGLNPNDPSDSQLDRNADGYLNIEEYINEIAG